MKNALRFAAVAINLTLLYVAFTNLYIAPIWTISMCLISSLVLIVITLDVAEDIKRARMFTMIELVAVIMIMAILLTVIVSVKTIDKSDRDVKAIGSLIKLYHSKTNNLNSGEYYTISISDKLTIVDHTGVELESEELTADIIFLDGATNRSFIFNHRGEVQSPSKILRFKVGEHKVKINNFTGKFSYYDESAEY